MSLAPDIEGADRVAGPSYAAAVGLVKWGAHSAPAAVLSGARGPHSQVVGTAYQRTVRWLRDFF